MAGGRSGYFELGGIGAKRRWKASRWTARLGEHRHGGSAAAEPDLVTDQGGQVIDQAAEAVAGWPGLVVRRTWPESARPGDEDRLVTVPRSEPDLNPNVSDLRKVSEAGQFLSRAYDVSAGQFMIAMCPRADSHLTYLIPIVLTTDFVLDGGPR